MRATKYWVYILLCNNGNYYTGYTSDLSRRYQEHITGSGRCKYTRSFRPLGMVQSWEFNNKSLALKTERLIKKLSRNQKQQLIFYPDLLTQYLPEDALPSAQIQSSVNVL